LDINDVALHLRGLLKSATTTQFAIGDYLAGLDLEAAAYKELSKLVGVRVLTLRRYEETAVTFPPAERRDGLDYGVYAHLARLAKDRNVPDAAELARRWLAAQLAELGSVTAGDAERFASEVKRQHSKREKFTPDEHTATATLPVVAPAVELTGDADQTTATTILPAGVRFHQVVRVFDAEGSLVTSVPVPEGGRAVIESYRLDEEV